jgi:hypothetical protein
MMGIQSISWQVPLWIHRNTFVYCVGTVVGMRTENLYKPLPRTDIGSFRQTIGHAVIRLHGLTTKMFPLYFRPCRSLQVLFIDWR